MLSPKAAFADTSGKSSSESEEAEPYSPDEFPNWSKKVRRAEIITLGSVPFTTLGVILTYGTYQYIKGESVSFPNPFDSSKNYDERQIKMIMGYTAAASCAIGLTDFLITFIKEKNAQRRLKKIRESTEQPTVTPITPEEAGNLMRQGNSKAQKEKSESQATDKPKSGQGE
ncbi:MAG: hypothetical protein J5817_07120 [Treponema sp.]|nr:hypothetical protein [Treponema sp.]